MNQQDFIAALRKENFGLDEGGKVNIPPSCIRTMESLLKIVSTDLYSSDIHCLYELIQNAQDNHYPENQRRKIQFILLEKDPTHSPDSAGCLCVINNETGFSEEDIASICDAGQSTKKSMKTEGFIGEKGIGFKSVFKVSSFPHIFSNGFHIHFKDQDSEIGLSYIVPYWTEQVPDVVQDNIDKTCILLPLKSGSYNQIKEALLNHKPETSLFLNKLEEICIDIPEENYQVSFALVREDENIINVTEHVNGKDAKYRYWLAEKKAHVPEHLNEAKREDVTERTVSIAFPLDGQEFHYNVFAYLPSDMKSGLPFLINGDFLMTSSRETFNESEWNKWLLEELAEHAAESIEIMLKSAQVGPPALKFIPKITDVQTASDRFTGFYDKLVGNLKQRTIIKCADGQWLKPASAFQVDTLFRSLFAESPVEHRNLWICKEYAAQTYSSYLREVDVPHDSEADILPFFDDKEWLGSRSASWFIQLYGYLCDGKARLTEKTINSLSIFPSECGSIHAAEEKALFVPNEEQSDQALPTSIYFPPVAFLREDVYCELLNCQKLRRTIIDDQKVISFDPATYYEHRLQPHLKSLADGCILPEASLEDKTALINWVAENWNKIKDVSSCPVLLSDGLALIDLPAKFSFVTPKNSSPACWSVLYSDDELKRLNILHPHYLTFSNEAKESIFSALNVAKMPAPSKIEQCDESKIGGHYTNYDLWVNRKFFHCSARCWSTQKKANLSILPKIFWHLDTAETLIRETFIRWVAENLERLGEEFKKNDFDHHYGSKRTDKHYSPCWYYLNLHPWLQTTHGYKCPDECFINDPNIKLVLGDSVPYLIDELPQPLIDALDVNTEASTDNIVNYLKSISNSKSNIASVTALYTALSNRSEDIQKHFSDSALIYIPEHPGKHWFKTTEVVWEDASILDDVSCQGLEKIYPSLRKFFTDKLKVQKNISPEKFAKLWLKLQGQTAALGASSLKMDKIYAALRKAITDTPNAEWLTTFKEKALLLTKKGEWKTPATVYIADDDDLATEFQNLIDFIYQPKNQNNAWLGPLASLLGARKLSESIEYTLCQGTTGRTEEKNRVLTSYSCWMICYAIRNVSPNGDKRLDSMLSNGTIEALFSLREQPTEQMALEARVSSTTLSKRLENQPAFIDWANGVLHIDPTAEQDDKDETIATLLSRYLTPEDKGQYADAFYRFLGIRDETAMEKKKKKKSDWRLSEAQKEAIQGIAGTIDSEPEVSNSALSIENHDEHSTMSAGMLTEKEATEAALIKEDDIKSDVVKKKIAMTSATTTPVNKPSTKPGEIATHMASTPFFPVKQKQLRAYVSQKPLPEDMSPEAVQRRKEQGDKGERIVLDTLKEKGYIVEKMPENNKGYDLKAVHPKTGDVLYIEVKSDAADWSDGGVCLSCSQYEHARKQGDAFYLAIVENIFTSQVVYFIQNPVELITEYRFGGDWKEISTDITIANDGVSNITSEAVIGMS